MRACSCGRDSCVRVRTKGWTARWESAYALCGHGTARQTRLFLPARISSRALICSSRPDLSSSPRDAFPLQPLHLHVHRIHGTCKHVHLRLLQRPMLARVRVRVLVLGGLLGFTERGLRSGGSWAGGARAGKGRGASGVCGVGDGGAGYGLRAAGRERGGCMWRAGEGTYERCPSVRAPRRVGRRASRRGRAGGPRCTGAAQRSAQASGLRT